MYGTFPVSCAFQRCVCVSDKWLGLNERNQRQHDYYNKDGKKELHPKRTKSNGAQKFLSKRSAICRAEKKTGTVHFTPFLAYAVVVRQGGEMNCSVFCLSPAYIFRWAKSPTKLKCPRGKSI